METTTQTLANVKTTATGSDNWIDNAESTTQVAIEAQTFYDKTLLKRLLPNLVFAKFAQKGVIPRHGGNKINWRKFNSLAPATTPLTEGVTPDGNNLTMAQVQSTLKQYGSFVQFSDVIDTVGIDPVLTEGAEVLGEQAGLTIDTVMRDAFCKGTNVQYANGKTAQTIAAADVINGTDVRKMVRTLRKNNVKPINGYYICIIDPEIAFDLQNDADWKTVNQYNRGGEAIYDGEIGKLFGVKFIETTNLLVKEDQGASSAYVDTHCALCFGQGAFGMADVEGQGATKPRIIVKPTGSAGTADPLNQRSTEGWKSMFACTILDNLAVVRYECAVSA